MQLKSFVIIIVLVCFSVSSYFVISTLVNSSQRFKKSQNVRVIGTNNNKEQNNSSVITSIKKISLGNETHIELSGTVADTISSLDINQNTVVMNLNDSINARIFLGSDTFRMFVRVYEKNSPKYLGKVMSTKDLLLLLSKDKKIQIELGLPKDDKDRTVITTLSKYAENSGKEFVQNRTIDIPERLIIRLSIF